MTLPLGPHAILNNATACQWAATAPVVKGLNTAVLRAAKPSSIQVYRHYFPDPQPLGDAVGTVNAILEGLGGYRAPNLHVELWNEQHPNAGQLLSAVQLLHAQGLKVAGGSYSTGDYDGKDFAACWTAGCDAIAVHCYWGNQGFTLDHALRYRRFWEKGDPPILITECGRDAVEGGKGGWHKDGISAEQYVAEFVSYAQEIAKDSYVLGATPFSAAPTPDWQAFETDSITPQLMAALGGNVPTPTPLPFDPTKITEFQVWQGAAIANLKEGKTGDDPRDPLAFMRYLKAVGKDWTHPHDYGLPDVAYSPLA